MSILFPNKTILTRAFLCLVLSLFINTSFAQDEEKKYPSLLWEISGNGTDKPSYLYGTMHVSSKLAFHLGDTFFMALESCDYVALESDATTWLSEMFGTEYMEETGGLYRSGQYYRDFYREAFEFETLDKRVMGSSLNFNNRIMNGMLYRESTYAAEFEEETYLDMYIHQAGKKLNKKIIGLEDFMESQRLVQKSDIPDEDEKDRPKNLDYRKLINSGKSPREMLEDAYRRADLDMVDSLQRIMNPSKNHQRYMLHERNAIMADNMDSIIQGGHTLFSGIGAAHLAGEKGVIEMMREKGYKVRPVVREIGEYSKEYRDKLEKTYVDLDFKPYRTSDGWFEVNVPGKLFEMPANSYYKMYFYPDMSNGTNYSLTRLRYFGPLRDHSKEYMLERIDSLLYENIPGKIIEQKEITRDGYPGFDIINRTKKSDYERILIFTTPLEMVIFKVGGTLDYVKDNDYLEEVFSSFRIRGKTEDWSTHTSPYGFKVDLPGTPITDDKNTEMKHLFGNVVELAAMNGDDFYHVKRTSYHDQSYIEEDTFEMAYIARQLAEEFEYEELSKEFLEFKGLQAMKTSYKDSNHYVHTLYMIDGARYYRLMAKTSEETWPERFFNSFERTDPVPIRPYMDVEDTTYYYTVRSNTKRAGYSAFDLAEISKRIRDKENNRNYEGNSDYIYYADVMSDDEVYMYYRQFSRYYFRPSYDSLWRSERSYFKYSGMHIDSEKIGEDSSTYDLVLSDTNSVRTIHIRFKVHGGVKYEMKYIVDSTGTSEFGETFFSSFEPSKDTVVGLPFNQNKGDLFFEDLFGEDSLAREYAVQSMGYVSLDKEHVGNIIKAIETFKHKDFGINERVGLIHQLGHIQHRDVLPYLSKVYKRSIDTAQFQVAVLNALIHQRTKSATRLFRELLEFETPLVSEAAISNLTENMSDSLSLYKDLFPFLLKFTPYPEYKSGVYVLMAEMLDSGAMKPKDYKGYRKDLVREAKDALKRIMAESHKESSYSYSRYSYNTGSDYEDLLIAYNTLLIPFKKQKDVMEYFNRTRKLNNESALMNTSIQMHNAGIAVHDSVWGYLANKEKYLITLYSLLEDCDKTYLIPDSCLAQEKVAKALLYRYQTIEEDDSVHFHKRIEASNKDCKGYVYIFKKKDQYNDAEWNYDYVGIMPADSSEIVKTPDVRNTGNDYLDDEDLDDNMKDVVENLRYEDRKRVKKKTKRGYYYGY